MSPSARPPEAGLVPRGERGRISASQLLGKRPPERRPVQAGGSVALLR